MIALVIRTYLLVIFVIGVHSFTVIEKNVPLQQQLFNTDIIRCSDTKLYPMHYNNMKSPLNTFSNKRYQRTSLMILNNGNESTEIESSSPPSSSSSKPSPPPVVQVKCPDCNLCDGSGRIMGGIGAIFSWIPVKAYRPCPNFIARGGNYERSGQGLDEIAFGRDSTFNK